MERGRRGRNCLRTGSRIPQPSCCALAEATVLEYDGVDLAVGGKFMQRNMDLVRIILMRIEGGPSGARPPHYGIQGFAPDEIAYHSHIMMQEGLIERSDV